ncbi:tetratricopeptide repeat protein [Streptomyces sp. NBC_00986]|uniref:tetratricopeptide repeat protein n=1 Tax=Streptomyces sp. NBC_00986 TaxID=2903702 RepID=UPI00386DEABD|nr:tetratricopeptide repeat protein [Streptomyces sp. NBC_00986]
MTDEDTSVSNTINDGVYFHAVIQGRDITVTLPPTITPALSGLPTVSSTFTGREAIMLDLLDGLTPRHEPPRTAPTAPRVAVAGLAGVGKTELAVQVATRALRRPGWFPGGVLFVDLLGYDTERRLSPERVLDGLLRSLGIPAVHIPQELQDLQRLYRSVLATFSEQGQRILVILDNVSSAEQAIPLMPSDGETACLVTSRHTLDIDARLHDLNVLDGESSIELLHQVLLRARGSSDTRVSDAPEAAASIACLCAGLPLALRIAAALLADAPTRPLASLADALQAEHSRLDRLRREDRAVRAAFDLSYQHLPSASARLFRLFSVNVGPDLSLATTAALADLDAHDAEEILQDLNRAHLIEPSGVRYGRWRMHDLIRLYAKDHSLGATHRAERTAGVERLYRCYLTTAEQADSLLGRRPQVAHASPRFTDRDAALAWFDDETLNLSTAATGAVDSGQYSAGIRLAMALDGYLRWRLAFPLAATVHEASFACAVRLGSLEGQAKSLNNLGIAYTEVNRYEDAIAAFTQAEQGFAELGDHFERGKTLNGWGTALRVSGHPQNAVPLHQEALRIQQEVGSLSEQAATLNNLSLAHQALGQHAQALQHSDEAARLYEQLADRRNEGKALCTKAEALSESGQPHEALRFYDRALDLLREQRDSHQEGVALAGKGHILAFSLHRPEDAASCWTKGAEALEQANEGTLRVQVLMLLGLTLHQLDRPNEAASNLREAVDVCREFGLAEELAEAQNCIALLGTS